MGADYLYHCKDCVYKKECTENHWVVVPDDKGACDNYESENKIKEDNKFSTLKSNWGEGEALCL